MTTMAELTTTKPSRSDEILDTEEQLRISYEIKAHFDALQPDRPIKPNRSEPGSPRAVNHSLSKNDIPELHKFQSLQSSSHVSNLSLSVSLNQLSEKNKCFWCVFLITAKIDRI